jgi:heterodisulfide reductase subunit C
MDPVHKPAGIKYLTHRLKAYPIRHEEKEKEENTITKMIESNGHDVKTLNKIRQKKAENNCKELQETKVGAYLHILLMKYALLLKYLIITMQNSIQNQEYNWKTSKNQKINE